MSRVLIFSGTTEGRMLSNTLAAANIDNDVCVATEYGKITADETSCVNLISKRLDRDEMISLIRENSYDLIVDATHPFAMLVTENIKDAAVETKTEYIRLKRDLNTDSLEYDINYFDTNEECAKALNDSTGNILLTTGSKELKTYIEEISDKDRVYVRVLPGTESLGICEENNISGKHIIAMQGPFSVELNSAIIKQFDIKNLVTKMSGRAGGYEEKLIAAKENKAKIFAIKSDVNDLGTSYDEVVKQVFERFEVMPETSFDITLAGIGMGNTANSTLEVKERIDKADIILGAKRLIAPYEAKLEKREYYLKDQIIPYIRELKERYSHLMHIRIVVLLSGDCGFYSGCTKLYAALKEMRGVGIGKIDILPGISSISYLSSKIGQTYDDALIFSMHGIDVKNLSKKIRTNKKIFTLTSGLSDLKNIAEAAMGLQVRITAGCNFSYDNESIETYLPEEIKKIDKEALYTCFIYNEEPERLPLFSGISDGEFTRAKVPMTKEEIRTLSVSKLHLYDGAVVYDIGSGSGSVSVQIASVSDEISVYAIEQKEEAYGLTIENAEKFGLENIKCIKAKAPEGFNNLPAPTHAFIGGSSGNLKEILDKLHEMNPKVRVVLNAISLETISEIKDVVSSYELINDEIVQLQVSRAKRIGNYNLMQAENPVWICAFEFK